MRQSSVYLCLPLAACLAGCGSGSSSSRASGTTADVTRSQPGEVQRVDDYPLYYMRTSSDYGFDAYRRGATGGAVPGPLAHGGAPRLAWACTCFSTAPSGDGPLFGRNFDWWHRASLLLYASPPNALASLSMVDLYYLDFVDPVSLDQLRGARDRIAQRAPYLPFAEALDLLSAVSKEITMWSADYDLTDAGVDVVPGRRYGKAYRFAMNGGR